MSVNEVAAVVFDASLPVALIVIV
jgi:hypothetical protein